MPKHSTFPKLNLEGGTVAGTASLFWWLLTRYPIRVTAISIGAMVATVSENLGLMLLVPIFQVTSGVEIAGDSAWIVDPIKSGLAALGVPFEISWMLVLLCVAIYAKAILMFGISLLRLHFLNYLGAEMRTQLVKAAMSADWNYLNTIPPGRLTNIVSNEVNLSRAAFAATLSFAVGLIAAVVYTGVAVSLSWQVVVAALGLCAFCWIVVKPLIGIVHRESYQQTEQLNQISRLLVEAIGGIRVLKAMHRHEKPLGLIAAHNRRLFRSQINSGVSGTLLRQLREPIAMTVIAVLVFVALVSLKTSIAVLGVMVIVLIRLINKIWETYTALQKVGACMGPANAVFGEIQRAQSAREDLNLEGRTAIFERSIEFRDVVLRYGNEVVIKSAKFSIGERGLYVILGPSGSGKSTLINGLLGFITPAEGKVLIDDVPIADINLISWREQIGYVPQDVFLFADSLRNNVTLGDETIKDEDIVAALVAAEVWDHFVETSGLDHQIDEGGGNLSGGQRQRVALARALVRRPRLLILDEATSALDKEAKQRVLDTISRIARETSVLAITHDPSFEAIAGRVFELQNGKVVEMGERRDADTV